jgi:hypothetical protein
LARETLERLYPKRETVVQATLNDGPELKRPADSW